MQFNESFYGAIPRIDPSKGVDTAVYKTPARIAGVNYTDDESLWGYFPLLICTPGKILHAASGDYTIKAGLASKIVASFERGDDTGSPREPLGVDTEHAIYTDGDGRDKRYNAYIVDEKVTASPINTYTMAGVKVTKDVAEGSETIMGKIAWLDDGYKLVESGTMPYMSIVFSDDKGEIIQGKPTITSNPADTQLPALVVCSMKEGINLETIIAQINEVLPTLTEQQLQALLDQLKGAPTDATPPAETTPASKEFDFATAFSKLSEEIKAMAAAKETLSKEDAGVIAAKEELIKAGYLPNVASEHANQFSGIKPENAVICAKSWLEKNKAPQLGSQLFTAKVDYPEDLADHARLIRANAKKEGKTMMVNESLTIAKEQRGEK